MGNLCLLLGFIFNGQNAINASVYINIESEKSRGHGSGIIVSSLPEKNGRNFDTYILTATHLFEDNKKEEVWVSIFDGQEIKYKAEICKKTVLRNDGPDLALLKIKTLRQMPFVKIASGDYEPKISDQVIQIGCPNGERPPKIMSGNTAITAINRYLGYGNIECSEQPETGRSGGGLLNMQYEVIGVCNNAEPKEHKGIYTSLIEIRKFLTDPQWQFLIGETNPTFITTDIFSEKYKDLELTDLNNQKIKFSSLKNKTVFINLWNTWCIPCVKEMSGMEKLYRAVKNEQIVFLFINDESPEELRNFLKNNKFDLPIYTITTGQLPLAKEVVPMTYVIYPDGRTTYQYTGSATWDTAEIINWLKELSKAK